MKAFTVLVAIGVIIGAIFGVSALAYVLGGFLEQWNLAWVSHLAVLLLGFVMIIATFLTLAERKWSAMMQDRIGPNRATIDLPGLRGRPLGGVFHVATDAVKMLTKEDFRPKIADPLLFGLAPVLAFAPVLALFAIVPVGPEVLVRFPSINVASRVGLQVANPNFGMLWVFGVMMAFSSLRLPDIIAGQAVQLWGTGDELGILGKVGVPAWGLFIQPV